MAELKQFGLNTLSALSAVIAFLAFVFTTILPQNLALFFNRMINDE